MSAPPAAAEPVVPAGDGGLARVRLDLCYDGTAFSGWARQPGLRTVQGVLEDALAVALRLRAVVVTVAGRTDAGVHATGQVCSLDVPLGQRPDVGPDLTRRLNGVLPADVRVRRASVVPGSFDARFAALGRAYRYRLTDGVADPLRRHDTVAWPRPLDAGLMATAATGLLGEHDFAAYCRRREGASTVRELRRLTVVRDGTLVLVDVEADAFCHSMVRALVGALCSVGEGRREVAFPATVLAAGVRDGRAPVAPAHGLTLVRVDYPDGEAALRARQALTRRPRALRT